MGHSLYVSSRARLPACPASAAESLHALGAHALHAGLLPSLPILCGKWAAAGQRRLLHSQPAMPATMCQPLLPNCQPFSPACTRRGRTSCIAPRPDAPLPYFPAWASLLPLQATVREVKRLDAVSRSPIYSAVGEAVGGLASIRAYRSEVSTWPAVGCRRCQARVQLFPSRAGCPAMTWAVQDLDSRPLKLPHGGPAWRAASPISSCLRLSFVAGRTG